MRAGTFLLILLVCLLSFSVFAAEKDSKTDTKELSAKEILQKLDDLWRGKSSKSQMSMEVKTKHWQRTMAMDVWSMGNDYSLVKVLKPLKERNTATLKVKDEIYNYLPKTDKTIKLTAAMMMGSWMGSHFTNDDLVKESRMADDYTYEVKERTKDKIRIVLLPKEDAAVVWGKIDILVRTGDYQPLQFIYYDEDGIAARTMSFARYEKVGDRVVPMEMKMIPADKPGEYTLVTYSNLEFDIKISKSFFSLNQLRH